MGALCPQYIGSKELKGPKDRYVLPKEIKAQVIKITKRKV